MNSNEIPLILPISGYGRTRKNSKDKREGFSFSRKLIFASAGLIMGTIIGYLGYRGDKYFKEFSKELDKLPTKNPNLNIFENPPTLPPFRTPSPSFQAPSPERPDSLKRQLRFPIHPSSAPHRSLRPPLNEDDVGFFDHINEGNMNFFD